MLGEIAKTYPLGWAHNGTGAMAGPLSMHQPQRCCLRTVAAGRQANRRAGRARSALIEPGARPCKRMARDAERKLKYSCILCTSAAFSDVRSADQAQIRAHIAMCNMGQSNQSPPSFAGAVGA
jgi:hypothetical protein